MVRKCKILISHEEWVIEMPKKRSVKKNTVNTRDEWGDERQ